MLSGQNQQAVLIFFHTLPGVVHRIAFRLDAVGEHLHLEGVPNLFRSLREDHGPERSVDQWCP